VLKLLSQKVAQKSKLHLKFWTTNTKSVKSEKPASRNLALPKLKT
jgi:hypothetical protein